MAAQIRPEPLDTLRLVALGRIERCSRCARLPAMDRALRGAGQTADEFPPVPSFCTQQICRPLVDRAREQNVIGLVALEPRGGA
jgi:hypothetical protein